MRKFIYSIFLCTILLVQLGVGESYAQKMFISELPDAERRVLKLTLKAAKVPVALFNDTSKVWVQPSDLEYSVTLWSETKGVLIEVPDGPVYQVFVKGLPKGYEFYTLPRSVAFVGPNQLEFLYEDPKWIAPKRWVFRKGIVDNHLELAMAQPTSSEIQSGAEETKPKD